MIKYLSVLNLIFFKMKSLFFLLISFIFFFAGNSYAQYFAESAITENIMDKDTASYAETELPNPKAEESSAENVPENETSGSDEKKAEASRDPFQQSWLKTRFPGPVLCHLGARGQYPGSDGYRDLQQYPRELHQHGTPGGSGEGL